MGLVYRRILKRRPREIATEMEVRFVTEQALRRLSGISEPAERDERADHVAEIGSVGAVFALRHARPLDRFLKITASVMGKRHAPVVVKQVAVTGRQSQSLLGVLHRVLAAP